MMSAEDPMELLCHNKLGKIYYIKHFDEYFWVPGTTKFFNEGEPVMELLMDLYDAVLESEAREETGEIPR